MKLYRVFAGLHYKGSMFAPFFDTQWTEDKKATRKAYKAVTLKDFKKSDIDIEILERTKADQLPVSIEKPSPETCFLLVEFVEVDINRKRIPPNDSVLEIADYEQKEISQRGICMNGRKMSKRTFKKILK